MKKVRIICTTLCCAALALALAVTPAIAGDTKSCPGDVNDDGVVNVLDLLEVINSWGDCPDPCPADSNGDGMVNVLDLLAVVNNFGPCGEPQCGSHDECDDGDPCTVDLCIGGVCYSIPIPDCR